MASKRKTTRAAREQLLTLVNGWDPAGRLAAGAPRDVYDPLVDAILVLLSRSEKHYEIANLLKSEVQQRYRADPKGVEQFVKKAATWHEMASREE